MYQQEKGLIGWRVGVSSGEGINQQQSGSILRRRYYSAAEWEYPPETILFSSRVGVSAEEDINRQQSGSICRRGY
nr:hypothetical protein BN993_01334 [Virgibacillus halodenitrificans]